jgi:hypothetical protein
VNLRLAESVDTPFHSFSELTCRSMSVHFKFETLLPYSLRIQAEKTYRASYEGVGLEFVHLGRVNVPRATGFVIAPHLLVPADKYGLFFRSRIALILPEDSVRLLMSTESDELQRVFPSPEPYVAHLFGSPGVNLTACIVTLLNRILGLYRVVYKEWHVSPLASVDLPSWRISKLEAGRETFLTALELPNQMAQGTPLQDNGEEAFFSESLKAGGTAATLPTLEADIHDRVSHGDLLVALILMGLLVEEGVRNHLTKYIQLREGISEDDAVSQLVKANGITYGLAEMVDPPTRARTCLIEDIAGWRPYEEAEYRRWNTDLRELRNEVIHRGRIQVLPSQAERAWAAAALFLRISFIRFVERLLDQGCQVDPKQVEMFRVRSNVAGTPGLFGAFNHR